jgi:hypothetical protein
MSILYTTLNACVLCESRQLRCAVPLAPMPIVTPNFRLPAGVSSAEAAEGVPLNLYQCEDCGHVQVGVIGNPELQYREYIYQTSLSSGLSEHFRRYAQDVVSSIALDRGVLVVEIGSNDGTLLTDFQATGMRVRGVDPARRIAEEATVRGIPTLADFFCLTVAQQIRRESGAATLIVANNVIANIPALDGFARGVEHLLADDGVFVFETQYGGDVVEHLLLDTVYHEHISYFLTKPTQSWLARFGLTLFDVVPIATKGGSFRVFAQKASGQRRVSPAVGQWIARETRLGMFGQPFFSHFGERIAGISQELQAITDAEHERGREVGGFGVSVGTSTLLAQLKLEKSIDFLVDDDPQKEPFLVGPGYRIPVISGAAMNERRPGTVIVFAWRYADQIASRHTDFLRSGGTFVVPLPQTRIWDAQTLGTGSIVSV